MLCLTLKREERLFIGDSIELIVLRTEKGRVRLGIAAPDNVDICRERVFRAIQKRMKPIEVCADEPASAPPEVP